MLLVHVILIYQDVGAFEQRHQDAEDGLLALALLGGQRRARAFLAQQLQLPARFWAYDPIPPWVLHVIDRTVLRDLAIAHLETQQAALQVQQKALERSIGILKNAKIGG